ncbi:hypothetical protein R3I93_022332 [Phoxinus phoxinus]|uniref:Uncharacterized protein n=1 Tax=Phoxinus phoxinus TaxID=58324 RepID=A0AAN9C5B8_9TELE
MPVVRVLMSTRRLLSFPKRCARRRRTQPYLCFKCTAVPPDNYRWCLLTLASLKSQESRDDVCGRRCIE